MKQQALDRILNSLLVPVVRAASAEQALGATSALLDGGIDIVEITMTVPGAVEVIREISRSFGERVLVGAGTVLRMEDLDASVDAGAKFIVSPLLEPRIVSACIGSGIPVAAGALTPTEIQAAWSAGADIVKVFPCDSLGGPAYIRALRGPFPEIPLMPTGGVTLDNAQQYLDAGANALGVGGSLVDLKLLRDGRWAELTARARAFRDLISPEEAQASCPPTD
jgi:2-dehydro-3-deoxyphosphogluconate aldolase/(4S)-4-hydroxy-2-oxoglutarate aldolase